MRGGRSMYSTGMALYSSAHGGLRAHLRIDKADGLGLELLSAPMERYCERCERVTVDGHLWCQDPECPAEEGYALLGYGDYLGDLKVTKLVRVWRTAALYEAERQGLEVLRKGAHPTDEGAERPERGAPPRAGRAPCRRR